MVSFQSGLDEATQRRLAADCFHLVWELMEKTDRDADEDTLMVNAAHASRFHWGFVGSPREMARGEWQLSRVYALLGQTEPSQSHAIRCLQVSVQHQLGAFDVGFAYEALARACSVAGDVDGRDEHLTAARNWARDVEDEADREWLFQNIATVSSLTLPVWKES